MKVGTFAVGFAGVEVVFISQLPIKVPEEFRPFLTEGKHLTDSYTVEILREPLIPYGELLYDGRDMQAYRQPEGTLLLYSNMETGGIKPGCEIRTDGRHILYATQELARCMGEGIRLSGIINGEEMLLRHRSMVLHCSVVNHKGQGVLFSGPSGIGKSTQGALWESVFGDRVINGDRGVLGIGEDGIFVGGSPWCGSSGIYSREQIPVKAIVLLRQGRENEITLADRKMAFREIYSQCIVHSWDRRFVDHICDLIWKLLDTVPVYVLRCVPEASAALLTEQTLFREERDKS